MTGAGFAIDGMICELDNFFYEPHDRQYTPQHFFLRRTTVNFGMHSGFVVRTTGNADRKNGGGAPASVVDCMSVVLHGFDNRPAPRLAEVSDGIDRDAAQVG